MWILSQHAPGVLVDTSESWDGAPVLADVDTAQRAPDDSLRSWLDRLEAAAEGAPAPGRGRRRLTGWLG